MANQRASLNGILLAGKVDSGALYLYWVVGRYNSPCRVMIPTNGSADTLRSICSYGDVGVLYLGGSQPMVRPRVCRGMRSRIRLRISSRGLAIRPAGSDLVPRSSGAVAAQDQICSESGGKLAAHQN